MVDNELQNKHIGSSLDDFLAEEGILEEVNEAAWKRVIAWQVQTFMAEKQMTKTELAQTMGTSRSALDRLLDPNHTSLNIQTLAKAAKALGKELKISLV